MTLREALEGGRWFRRKSWGRTSEPFVFRLTRGKLERANVDDPSRPKWSERHFGPSEVRATDWEFTDGPTPTPTTRPARSTTSPARSEATRALAADRRAAGRLPRQPSRRRGAQGRGARGNRAQEDQAMSGSVLRLEHRVELRCCGVPCKLVGNLALRGAAGSPDTRIGYECTVCHQRLQVVDDWGQPSAAQLAIYDETP